MRFALALLLGGCCTDVGCYNGVLLRLENVPPGDLEVVVEDDGGERWSCMSGEEDLLCTAGATHYLPTIEGPFTVRILVDTEVVHEEEVVADYGSFRPNGPVCPPKCSSAGITVRVP